MSMIRRGGFSLAGRYYREALEHTTGVQPGKEDPLADFSALGDYFTIGAELRAQEAAKHRLAARQTALMRLALLGENEPASDADNKAMALYFKSLGCPTADARRRLLLKVQEAAPSGPLADNVLGDLAMLEPGDEERLAKLEALATSRARTDGAMLARLSAAEILIRAAGARLPADPSGLARARKHLEEVKNELARRFEHDPEDPYVAALADLVEKRLLYVGAQIRRPESAKP